MAFWGNGLPTHYPTSHGVKPKKLKSAGLSSAGRPMRNRSDGSCVNGGPGSSTAASVPVPEPIASTPRRITRSMARSMSTSTATRDSPPSRQHRSASDSSIPSASHHSTTTSGPAGPSTPISARTRSSRQATSSAAAMSSSLTSAPRAGSSSSITTSAAYRTRSSSTSSSSSSTGKLTSSVPDEGAARQPVHTPDSLAPDVASPSQPRTPAPVRDSEGFVIPPTPTRRRTQAAAATSTSSGSFSTAATSPVVHICPDCGRTFPTKIGLGQHRRNAHRLEYEAEVNLARKKARWSAEEVRLLAMKEAELVRNNIGGINERLQEFMPTRTFDSIKSRRRNEDYKRLVQEFMDANPLELEKQAANAVRVTTCLSTDLLSPFLDVIKTISTSVSTPYKEDTLNRLWTRVDVLTPNQILGEVSMYIREVFPDRPAREPRSRNVDPEDNLPKRQQRHNNYKKTQALYKKNRSRCIQGVLSPTSVADSLSSTDVFHYWKNLMQEKCTVPDDVVDYFEPHPVRPMVDIWTPVTMEEVKSISFQRSTAPGPDGLTAEDYNQVPKTVLCKIFNLFMVIGEVPTSLLRGRTIFIPKKTCASSPGDLRPISISSVLLRAFHKIIARRLQSSVQLDQRQRGFISEDGCGQNVFLLDLLLKHQREKLKDIYLASVDLHKAFDSLSYDSIFAAASASGLSPQVISYLRFFYHHSSTTLAFGNSTSSSFTPSRGVRQGDPLSPLLFNLVVDRLFKNLPSSVGIDVANVRVNALAYADDLILVASSARGLQLLLDQLEGFLRRCSLKPNIAKSFTLSLRAAGKEKKVVTDPKSTFKLDNQYLRPLTAVDTFTYLGVEFNSSGRLKISKVDLMDLLVRLRRAPLKPQQRLFALKFFVIAKFYHRLTLGKLYIGFLRQLDMMIRTEVRRWLKLPHDTPVAYFYTSVGDGGLGIPSLRWMVPLLKVRRLERVRDEYLNFDNRYISSEISFAKRFLQDRRMAIKNKNQVNLLWKKKLYLSVDGSYLKDSGKVAGQHAWVGDGTSFLSSKDYISCLRLRINALPVKSRTTRGRRHIDRQCRAGCLSPETLNHVLQDCHRTQAARIARHDALVDYLQRFLTSRSHVVVREARFNTDEGVRKPDIVAVRNQEVFVIDAQVVGSVDLEKANKTKINKYKNNESLQAKIRDRFNTNTITYLALTISNRGVWSKTSANDLLHHGLLHKRDIKVLSTRAVIGGFAAFRIHGSMTSQSERSDYRRRT